MNSGFDKNRTALIIGTILVFLGLWQLLRHFFGDILSMLWNIIGLVIGVLGALAIMAVGILLVIASRKDKLNFPNGKKLYRSTRNRKIAGVCGGIAEYLSIEHATVRIVTLVLAVVAWYLVLPLYLILWITLPPDTQSFNTWI
ncbi:MAG: PspC domain-containing protein [Coriobacteriales bacterium]|jgi:phage shock protein PspC (stress-responsive transcriptional regulator)|nr:PspC domain-containing protein [Coriobacteriales bacterium]